MKNYEMAILIYEKILEADPKNTEVMDLLADLYLENEDVDKALPISFIFV